MSRMDVDERELRRLREALTVMKLYVKAMSEQVDKVERLLDKNENAGDDEGEVNRHGVD